MAFLNSLMASSSQPRSASSMPRALCSSDCESVSFSLAMVLQPEVYSVVFAPMLWTVIFIALNAAVALLLRGTLPAAEIALGVALLLTVVSAFVDWARAAYRAFVIYGLATLVLGAAMFSSDSAMI